MRIQTHLENLARPLVEYRIVLSLGLSASSGIVPQHPVSDPHRESAAASDRIRAAFNLQWPDVEATTYFCTPLHSSPFP